MKKNILFLLIALCYNLTTFSQDIKITDDSSEEVPFAIIENVPIFSGCDKSLNNEALRKCMSSKVSEHVSKHFNADISKQLDLPNGQVRINVIFKVDKEGRVIHARARSSHPELENEAVRVINLIPQFEKPGYQKGKPVIVPYSLPIIFNIDNSKSSNTLTKYPVYKGCDPNAPNEIIKKCTEEKIVNFIKMSVDMEMASKLFPTQRSTQFKVEFTISKKGKIKDVTAKAHHRSMAIEVINVAKRIPKLKAPGYKGDKAVDTPFSMLMTLYFN